MIRIPTYLSINVVQGSSRISIVEVRHSLAFRFHPAPGIQSGTYLTEVVFNAHMQKSQEKTLRIGNISTRKPKPKVSVKPSMACAASVTYGSSR